MIQFVSSPDDIVGEELVGRVVVQGIIPGWPSFRHPAKVIEASEAGAVVSRLDANYSDSEGMWLFTDNTAKDQQIVKFDDIRAVCDSAEEVNRLIIKSREAVQEFNTMRDRLETEFLKVKDGTED